MAERLERRTVGATTRGQRAGSTHNTVGPSTTATTGVGVTAREPVLRYSPFGNQRNRACAVPCALCTVLCALCPALALWPLSPPPKKRRAHAREVPLRFATLQPKTNVAAGPFGGIGEGFGMRPLCIVLVCSWRRLLADRHSLPFPWTLSLHRRWCPLAMKSLQQTERNYRQWRMQRHLLKCVVICQVMPAPNSEKTKSYNCGHPSTPARRLEDNGRRLEGNRRRLENDRRWLAGNRRHFLTVTRAIPHAAGHRNKAFFNNASNHVTCMSAAVLQAYGVILLPSVRRHACIVHVHHVVTFVRPRTIVVNAKWTC